MGEKLIKDHYNRVLSYLRISVTDRCNLNCLYCRRWNFTRYFPPSEILTYEELLRLVRIGTQLGINKVRITGGEPFVRKDVCTFIRQVALIPGVADLSVTTNGLLLKDHLDQLKEAGVKRLNISLDTLQREKYKLITGRDAYKQVWEAIMAALEAGFDPVKINMVVMRGINDDEVSRFAELTLRFPFQVRFIEYMPSSQYQLDQYRQMLSTEIKERLQNSRTLYPVVRADSSNIVERFRYEKGVGEIGFISPISKHFCKTCNRLRLTADGMLKPCLLSEIAIPIKKALRDGLSDDMVAGLINEAAILKPRNGVCATRDHEVRLPELMSAIGG